MSSGTKCDEQLNVERVNAGIAFCVKKLGLGRVLLIRPENIEMDHAINCFFAKCSGKKYLDAVQHYKLDKEQQVDLGFIGGRYCRTEELTPIYQRELKKFQERHHR
jgi:hypothetical protein